MSAVRLTFLRLIFLKVNLFAEENDASPGCKDTVVLSFSKAHGNLVPSQDAEVQTFLMGVNTVLVQTEKPAEVEKVWRHHSVGSMHFYCFSRRCHLQPRQMPMRRMKNPARLTMRSVLQVPENFLASLFVIDAGAFAQGCWSSAGAQ